MPLFRPASRTFQAGATWVAGHGPTEPAGDARSNAGTTPAT